MAQTLKEEHIIDCIITSTHDRRVYIMVEQLSDSIDIDTGHSAHCEEQFKVKLYIAWVWVSL